VVISCAAPNGSSIVANTSGGCSAAAAVAAVPVAVAAGMSRRPMRHASHAHSR